MDKVKVIELYLMAQLICFFPSDMVTEDTINPAYTMAQSVATSPHRIMVLLWMLPICQRDGQLCSQMLMTKQMKE